MGDSTYRSDATVTTRRSFLGRLAQAGVMLSPLAAAAHACPCPGGDSADEGVDAMRGASRQSSPRRRDFEILPLQVILTILKGRH